MSAPSPRKRPAIATWAERRQRERQGARADRFIAGLEQRITEARRATR